MAADAQAVYDMNVMARRSARRCRSPPVFVAFDGFFTPTRSAAWRSSRRPVVRDFLGPFVPTVSSVDMKTPSPIGRT